ncbi:ferritin-like domain-containing protein [Dyadobacter crusticola]|uniref:ferritin-like domain-containing protein n=1 Tax=Dyadobacter crusticola TaxID=292407 RepID=UPI0004E1B837|nr:PA2169 family four-helix-bundle protein [Dyadobacter crusticola]
MAQNSEIVEVLNDLILINNDRIEGYKKASDETNATDSDLKSLFSNLAEHSRQHVEELRTEVTSLGGEPATGTMISGKIYRAWMDVKAVFSSKDRQTALENSEFGEDAAQKAYEAALKSDALTPELHSLVTRQKATLKSGHDTIKRLRDAEKVLH